MHLHLHLHRRRGMRWMVVCHDARCAHWSQPLASPVETDELILSLLSRCARQARGIDSTSQDKADDDTARRRRGAFEVL